VIDQDRPTTRSPASSHIISRSCGTTWSAARTQAGDATADSPLCGIAVTGALLFVVSDYAKGW